MSEKKSFLDVIKEAQRKKTRDHIPDAKGQESQKAKFGNQPPAAKPLRKNTGRGR